MLVLFATRDNFHCGFARLLIKFSSGDEQKMSEENSLWEEDNNEDAQEENSENSDGLVSLSVTVSADRDLFTRRSCPKCGLEFKILADDNELSWLLNEQVRRQFDENESPTPSENAEPTLTTEFCCPYCESVFDSKKSFTEETMNYARRMVHREIIIPMLNDAFGDLEDSFGGNRSSGGLISISFQHNRQIKPPRPFHEPEPADMKIVHFLCCGRKAKIMENWEWTKLCVYCQSKIALV